ncbi:MAG: glycosyltransferase family 2 protein [Nanoarchaeota archaeon]
MPGLSRVSIIFPTLNEEKNIGATLDKAESFLKETFSWWEVIVVDNASTDKTLAIVDEARRDEPRIRLLRHLTNLGYAKSTEDGLHAAKGDFIFIIDSDGQHDIKDVVPFIQKLKSGDGLVVGWKRKRNDPLSRLVMAKGYNALFRLLFGGRLHDVDCGFKGYSKALAKRLRVEYHNVPVGAEICAKAQRMGFRIGEIEVKHFARKGGRSSFHPLKMPVTITKIFWSLFVLRWRLRDTKS